MAASSDQVERTIQRLLIELRDTEQSLSEASACLATVLKSFIDRYPLLTNEQNQALRDMKDLLSTISLGGRILQDDVFQGIDLTNLSQEDFQNLLARFNNLITATDSPFVQHIVKCGIVSANNALYLDLFVNDYALINVNRNPMKQTSDMLAHWTREADGKHVVIKYDKTLFYYDGKQVQKLSSNPALYQAFHQVKNSNELIIPDNNVSALIRKALGIDTPKAVLRKEIETAYSRSATESDLKFKRDSFHSLFTMPMQRVMRYSMLLIELSRHAPGNEFAASLKRKAIRFANTTNKMMLMFVDTQNNKSTLLGYQKSLEDALSDRLEQDASMSVVGGTLPVLSDETIPEILDTTNMDSAMTNASLSLYASESLPWHNEPAAFAASSSSNEEQAHVRAAVALFTHFNKDGLVYELMHISLDAERERLFNVYLDACQRLYPDVSRPACEALFHILAEEVDALEFEGIGWRDEQLNMSTLRSNAFRDRFIQEQTQLDPLQKSPGSATRT